MTGPAFYKSHDVKFRKIVLLNVVWLKTKKNEKEKTPEKNIFAQYFSMSNCVMFIPIKSTIILPFGFQVEL